jgi:hypothetical protein
VLGLWKDGTNFFCYVLLSTKNIAPVWFRFVLDLWKDGTNFFYYVLMSTEI